MSNEITIKDTERDDHMYGELHDGNSCGIEERYGNYRDNTGALERTLKVLVFFMVCRCKKKKRNPLPNFDNGQWITVGESLDFHLPNKGCNHKEYPQYNGTKFKCFCFCRHQPLSHPGR